MLLELATFHLNSVRIAWDVGVHRLELCEDYACGGLTPSDSFFDNARQHFDRDIFVMIRPRPGGYIFSDVEVDKMVKDIRKFRLRGANGFVSGCFADEETIQVYHLKKMLEACDGLPFTFHRSFDALTDWKKGLDVLMDAGCTRLLTSGDGITAEEGRFRLQEMMDFCGDQLIILPGSGIRSVNLHKIIYTCHPLEVHSAALMENSGETASAGEIEAMLHILNSYRAK